MRALPLNRDWRVARAHLPGRRGDAGGLDARRVAVLDQMRDLTSHLGIFGAPAFWQEIPGQRLSMTIHFSSHAPDAAWPSNRQTQASFTAQFCGSHLWQVIAIVVGTFAMDDRTQNPPSCRGRRWTVLSERSSRGKRGRACRTRASGGFRTTVRDSAAAG
jgi:hypothetical protein